jgi:hypothetical protein
MRKLLFIVALQARNATPDLGAGMMLALGEVRVSTEAPMHQLARILSRGCQNYRCGSSDIDGMIIILLGRMVILYSSEWRIYTITALSAES